MEIIQKSIGELTLHPEQKRIPFGSEGEFESLKEDIQQKGIETPLDINAKGEILDGRRRKKAADELGLLTVPCRVIEVPDEIEFIFRMALLRRNLSDYARIELADSYRAYLAEKANENQRTSLPCQKSDNAPKRKKAEKIDTLKMVADKIGVSKDTVARGNFINKHGTEEQKEQLRAGAISINAVYEKVNKQVKDAHRAVKAEQARLTRPDYTYNEGDGYENKIIQGDSREVLKQVPDNTATLVVFSPPYPTALVNYDVYKYEDYQRDYLDLLRGILTEAFRVLRKGGRCVINLDQTSKFGWKGKNAISGKHDVEYDTKTIAYSLGFGYMDDAVWYKQITAASRRKLAFGTPFSPRCPNVRRNHECILMFFKESRILEGDETLNEMLPGEFDHFTVSAWNYDAGNRDAAEINPASWWFVAPSPRKAGGHPCPFPEKLIDLVISCYTRRGDLVIDPCNGSGTTCVVAQRKGRRYLGIDLSEEYCKIAQQRLAASAETETKTTRAITRTPKRD